jgi:prevent-host-death family protein
MSINRRRSLTLDLNVVTMITLNEKREMTMQAKNVGIREAKMNLSKLLKMVQSGNEIILTDRGRPVGKIVPVEEEALPLAERMRRLEEQGLIEGAPSVSRKSLSAPILIPEGIAQRYLQEDRGDGPR